MSATKQVERTSTSKHAKGDKPVSKAQDEIVDAQNTCGKGKDSAVAAHNSCVGTAGSVTTKKR